MKEKLMTALGLLLQNGQDKNITVALSGGADSVALLHGLLSVRDELGLTVCAAHLNHLLRGDESDRDEQFVRALCQNWQVPLTVKRVDVHATRKTGESIELAARNARYAFFDEVSYGTVATAHTASDNAETVLLHLARGSGLAGLCGIPARRGNIIRPLLACTETEIRAYCMENELDFVTDSTNNSDTYTRNFVRHNVVPLMEKINPSFSGAVGRMCENLSEERRLLDELYRAEFLKRDKDGALCVDGFSALAPAVAKGTLRVFLHTLGISPDSMLTALAFQTVIEKKAGFSLPDRRFVFHQNGLLYLKNEGETLHFCVKTERKSAETIKQNGKINNLLLKNAIDCDKIVGTLSVRTRQPGDRITLAHRGVTKTLKKLFCEDGLSDSLRENCPVIADGAGVVWVYGYGVDRRVCPTEKTGEIFAVTCSQVKL